MVAVYCTQAELTAALAALPAIIDGVTATFEGESVISGNLIDARSVVTGLVDLIAARQKDTAPPAVVVATPTIMGGLVLRWYRDENTARYSDAALASASRSGVMLNGGSYLHDIPSAWIFDAQRACEMLQHGQEDRARELATHRRAFSGELTEVTR